MSGAPVTRVLFVCYANVVRSPLAEAVFRHLVAERGLQSRFVIRSAGISALDGAPPDPGSVEVAAAHGIALAGRARQMTRDDLFDHHHVLVVDRHVGERIRRLMGASAFGSLGVPARVRLLASLADPEAEGDALDVADPLHGGPEGFARMFVQVRRACEALLAELAPRT